MTMQSQSDYQTNARGVMEMAFSKQRVSICPSLYQINTRALIQELGRTIGRPATFDDIPDSYIDQVAQQKFDWVWFLGVWQTGTAGRTISRQNHEWLHEFQETLPNFTNDDICGSCFAITGYVANSDFGGDAALDRLRDRVHLRNLKLLLDFVPNHTALDHEWVKQHPEFYIRGTEEKLRNEPQNYVNLGSAETPDIFAYGRDPYFDGWPDTLQLNYAEPALQSAMLGELRRVATHCDGVRCDMAMLILPEVFERTWGKTPGPFWPGAIKTVRDIHPDFLFMAEVYWGLEWTLQQQGFTYTYDKRLYDRLRDGVARPVRDHFRADMDFQLKSARFLENHDEPRAATVFSFERYCAAAVLTFLCPGLRFFHDGQFQGRTKKLSVHLGRRPVENINSALQEFYAHLLACVNLEGVRNGIWSLLESSPAWDGNGTSDCFIGFSWDGPHDKIVVVVNFAQNQSQCYLRLPFPGLSGHSILLEDLMGHESFERDGDQLSERGIYLDMKGWGYHVFRMAQPTA
jgi:Alpha amylase, catalytic domain